MSPTCNMGANCWPDPQRREEVQERKKGGGECRVNEAGRRQPAGRQAALAAIMNNVAGDNVGACCWLRDSVSSNGQAVSRESRVEPLPHLLSHLYAPYPPWCRPQSTRRSADKIRCGRFEIPAQWRRHRSADLHFALSSIDSYL